MKNIPFLTSIAFALCTIGSALAGEKTLDLGDTAYVYIGQGMGNAVHAEASIEDIRGDKMRIRVKSHCWNGGSLFGCKQVGLRGAQYSIGEYYWIDKAKLKSNW
jgi:hypothetical protein